MGRVSEDYKKIEECVYDHIIKETKGIKVDPEEKRKNLKKVRELIQEFLRKGKYTSWEKHKLVKELTPFLDGA